MYKVLKFTSENLAVQKLFYFIFFNPIVDYQGWQAMLYLFSDGICYRAVVE